MKTPLVLSLFTFTGIALAAYTLDWSTIDAGGGRSAGGAYTVAGTVGQPDAGKLTGGAYTLTGGFWALPELLQVPNGPPLDFHADAGVTYLRWPAPSPGWHLETSTNLTTWNAVPGTPAQAGGMYLMPADTASPRRCYRLNFP